MRAWEYLEKGKEVQNLRAFLYRVATNLIIDQSRKKKEEHLEVLMEVDEGWEPSYEDADTHETRMSAKEVFLAMNLLRPEEKEVLTLRYVDELELGEISEILSISSNHVSVKLNRAIKRLRKHLPQESLTSNI